MTDVKIAKNLLAGNICNTCAYNDYIHEEGTDRYYDDNTCSKWSDTVVKDDVINIFEHNPNIQPTYKVKSSND